MSQWIVFNFTFQYYYNYNTHQISSNIETICVKRQNKTKTKVFQNVEFFWRLLIKAVFFFWFEIFVLGLNFDVGLKKIFSPLSSNLVPYSIAFWNSFLYLFYLYHMTMISISYTKDAQFFFDPYYNKT